MSNSLPSTLNWIGSKFTLYMLIIVALLMVAWGKSEWQKWQENKDEIIKLEALQVTRMRGAEMLDKELSEKRTEWDQKKTDLQNKVRGELANINSEIANQEGKLKEASKELSNALRKYSDLQVVAKEAEEEADRVKKKIDGKLGYQWRYDEYQKLGGWNIPTIFGMPIKGIANKADYNKLVKDLNWAKLKYSSLQKSVDSARTAVETSKNAKDLISRKLEESGSPIPALHRKKSAGEKELQLATNYTSPEEIRMLADKETREQEINRYEALLRSKRDQIAKDPKQRFIAQVNEVLVPAGWILLGVILTPLLIKLLFYYVLAPAAEKWPSIRILSLENPPPIPTSNPSKVSLQFDIEPDKEILIHQDFLQSSDQPSSKRTQWFLNPRIPFSSIASGMFVLTRIRATGDTSTRIVVSSQNDPFGEIAEIEIPKGAAMVVQPRSLAGIIKKRESPVVVKRHWRLGLHAWLTLQLRFLVFYGPCKIILKGTRGVRVEEPDPHKPRIINQANTIAFSANLDYRNTRCETFVSYLRGKEDLFNDRFGGGPGIFVSEEMPGGRHGGITGRGLEGIVDAALKVFGI